MHASAYQNKWPTNKKQHQIYGQHFLVFSQYIRVIFFIESGGNFLLLMLLVLLKRNELYVLLLICFLFVVEIIYYVRELSLPPFVRIACEKRNVNLINNLSYFY